MKINTFVITTHNNYMLTQALLETLYLTLNLQEHEVIIVDDRSSDRTLELKQRFQFINNNIGGLYRSWNIGIQAAQTPYVTVLNNDLLFQQRDWWNWLYSALIKTDFQFVYPVNYETHLFDSNIYEDIAYADSLKDLSITDGYGDIKASCFCAKRELFDRLGWFDEHFSIWYGEKDFEIRLAQAKIRYGCVQNVISRHLGNQTIRLSPEIIKDGAGMTDRAREDYVTFKKKYAQTDLKSLGFSIKSFGPAALIASSGQ